MEEKKTWLERMASKVPDPVVLFLLMYAVESMNDAQRTMERLMSARE